MFTQAIVRPPAPNFAEGLTAAALGPPDYKLALQQHDAYCGALEQCGLNLTRLEPDAEFPDSTFVEDAAILTPRGAILTRPGAPSRTGEIESMRKVLSQFFPSLHEIQSPGTLDGGDVCQAGNHFFIGISARTNEAGAKQLSEFVSQTGYSSSLIDMMKSVPEAVATGSLLHLKSGLAYLGDKRLVIAEELQNQSEFAPYNRVCVNPEELYAANCIRVNDHVLIAQGFPKFEESLRELGYRTIALEVSEFRKMDGGLSCLSLRF